MKTYKAQFNKGKSKGVFAISLVERPAMEGLFVALSENEQSIKFATVNQDKQILVGLVLEPNKPIFRVNEETGEEYNMIFEEETIQELAYNFFQSNSHHNSTLEHEPSDKLQNITFVESWIVEDKDKDKSNKYGLSYPVGSWMATMKVNDAEVWENYVKTGKVLGFSIDAMLSLEEVQTLNTVNMNNQSLLESIKETIKTALSSEKEVVVKMGSVMTADGVAVEFEGDMLEVGKEIYVTDAEGNKVLIPIGEYQLEDGTTLVVTEEGIVGEIRAVAVEEPTEQAQAPNNDSKIAEEISSAIKSVLIKYNELERKVDSVITENTKLKAEIVELSQQPASRPIASVPMQIDLSKLTTKERILYNLRNKN